MNVVVRRWGCTTSYSGILMNAFAKIVLAASAILLARPVAATVTYTYSLSAGNGFVYTAPTFITTRSAAFAPPNDNMPVLDSCTTIAAFGACQYAQFLPTGTFNAAHDVIGFGAANIGQIFSYFADGAFGAAGVYRDTTISGSTATLTVKNNAVPEPATFAALALGAGLVGWTRRRRA